MDTTSRTLEITVISGEDLRRNRRHAKENAFVIVQTDSNNIRRTKPDFDNGSYPAWNEKLVIQMPMHVHYITIEVQSKKNSGDKLVGTARIPESDFARSYVPENYLQFLSYRLRDGKGERNGIINLSLRVTSPLLENSGCAGTGAPQCVGVPVGSQQVSNMIQVGYPVSYEYKM